MKNIKVGPLVTISIDNKIEQEITIISKSQYQKIRRENKKLATNLVVRSSPLGKAVAGKSVGQTGTMKLPHSKHKIEILRVEESI